MNKGNGEQGRSYSAGCRRCSAECGGGVSECRSEVWWFVTYIGIRWSSTKWFQTATLYLFGGPFEPYNVAYICGVIISWISVPNSVPLSVVVVSNMPEWLVQDSISSFYYHSDNKVNYHPTSYYEDIVQEAAFEPRHLASQIVLNLFTIPQIEIPIDRASFSWLSTPHSSFGPIDHNPWEWTFFAPGWHTATDPEFLVHKRRATLSLKPLGVNGMFLETDNNETDWRIWMPLRLSCSCIVLVPFLPRGSSWVIRLTANASLSLFWHVVKRE